MANVQDRGPPSAASIAIGTAIISGLFGYYLGQARSIGLFGKPSTSAPAARVGQHAESDDSDISDADADAQSDDEADSVQDLGELKTFPGNNEECKLVLVVRTDLGMTKDPSHPILRRWERLGQAKVALKVDSEDDVLMLQAQAVSLGLCAQVIHDAGRTQIASGSATVLGIGPAPKSKIDEVTGHLKLL
ncbi:hypothetical protein LTR85_007692 [Meristemomyces frigidus]|nr:hypothetical protein LTR85_007692 [Meristemomyces frigidus]